MAIETTFSIKQISVEQALAEAEKKVDRSAQRMDASLDKVGKDSGKNLQDTLGKASKGMDAVGKAGGKVGGVLKNLTQGIAGMMSPIGMVTAGITGIIALVTKLYEHAKEKAQQLVDTYIWEAGNATKGYDKLKKQHSDDARYLQRLESINSMEKIDNSTKQEAVRIIDHLTKRYGDLGLSIDTTTGKIFGLTKATRAYARTVLESEIRAAETASVKQGNVVSSSISQQFGSVKQKYGGATSIISAFNPIPVWNQFLASIGDARIGSGAYPTPYDDSAWKVLEEKHLPDAVRRYVGMVGLDEAKKHPKWGDLSKYYTATPDSEEVKRLLKQRDEVQEMWGSKRSTPEQMKNFEKQFDLLTKMVAVQKQIETAYEMQEDQNLSSGDVQHWRKVYEEARQYYDVLNNILNLYQFGNDTGNITNPFEAQIKQLQALETTLAQAQRSRESALNQKAGAEKGFNQAGMSKKDIMRELEQENWDYTDKIHNDEEALRRIEIRYENLIELQKSYDQYKNDKGVIEDETKYSDYLQVSAQLTRIKTEQAEKEAEIAQAQAEQLGIQSKLKQYQEELNKLERERIKEQAKKTLKWLFSGVLGDLKETTNSLTQRGGYLSGVNTMNALQINKQILNTVITANNYLASIKTQLNNVGKI